MVKQIMILILALSFANVFAQSGDNYAIKIESGTPKVLASIIAAAKAQNIKQKSVANGILWSAEELLGKPYKYRLLDQSRPEYLYISLNDTDCMLFIEEVVAIAELTHSNQLNMTNYTKEIAKLRYHGDINYCNRNHYFKDWALVNIKKGIFIDEAWQLSKIPFPYQAAVMGTRLVNMAESNPDKVFLSCIKNRENLINQEKLGFIPIKLLPKYLKQIRSGDIIGIVRTPNGHADAVHHLGVAYVTQDGVVAMIHASSDAGKVVVATSLVKYLARFSDSQGIILLRAR